MGKVRTLVSLTKLSVKTLRDYLNKILLFIPKLFLMITSVSSKMNQSLEICCRYRVQLRILLPPYDLPKICTPPPLSQYQILLINGPLKPPSLKLYENQIHWSTRLRTWEVSVQAGRNSWHTPTMYVCQNTPKESSSQGFCSSSVRPPSESNNLK